MKLATFTHAGTTRIGVVVDDAVKDLAATALWTMIGATGRYRAARRAVEPDMV